MRMRPVEDRRDATINTSWALLPHFVCLITMLFFLEASVV
jgi:hypothetical protein